MIWAVTSVTFLLTQLVVMVLFYSFAENKVRVGAASLNCAIRLPGRQNRRLRKATDGPRARRAGVLGKLAARSSPSKQTPRSSLMLIRAGYRSDDARIVIRGVKVLLPIVSRGDRILHRSLSVSPFIVLAVGGWVGSGSSGGFSPVAN